MSKQKESQHMAAWVLGIITGTVLFWITKLMLEAMQ